MSNRRISNLELTGARSGTEPGADSDGSRSVSSRFEVREVWRRAAQLSERRVPYALATVVWCRAPTSAKPGDRALVTADGSIEGWIGGGCSEGAVVRECLRALREGSPRLLHLGPADRLPAERPGVTIAPIGCASEGELEVYVEPHVPRPHLVAIGDSPVAETLAEMARALEFDVTTRAAPGSDRAPLDLAEAGVDAGSYVVVATRGRWDESALVAALATEASYVALVASRKRAAAVLEELRRSGVPEERLGRIRSPAGLDLGHIEDREIAVAILAEIVREKAAARSGGAEEAPTAPIEAIDPVCGMTVNVATAEFTADWDGRTYYFCCDGCRRRFEREPERYITAGP